MAGPADDLRESVKGLGMSDPMAQIGTALGRIGQGVEDAAEWAKDKAKRVMETAQGTTRGVASKDAGKKLKSIKIVPSANGGFIVSHHYMPAYGGTPKPDVHVFSDYDAAHAHLTKHVGGE